MTWGDLSDAIYERTDGGKQSPDDELIFEYDVAIDGVLGPTVSGFEVDHDAQKVILKLGHPS